MNRLTLWVSAVLLAVLTFGLGAVSVLAQETIPAVPDPAAPTSSSIIDGFLAMSNTTLYLVLVGMLLSAIYAIVARQDMSDDYKAIIFAAVCLVAGALYAYIDQDGWNSNDTIRRALTIWAAGTAFYLIMKSPLRKLSLRSDSALGRTT